MPEVEWSADLAQAEWIGPRLAPFDSGALTSVVPAGFAAYARVLHPAHDSEERPIRWSKIAARNGLELDLPGPMLVLPVGRLRVEHGQDLVQVVSTRDSELSDGTEPGVYVGPRVVDPAAVPPGAPKDPVPREVRDGPRVELPHRTYFLYRGGVEAALAFVESERQTPNLWWPQDRAWCIASELDLRWTYIGGSVELIRDIVGDGRLEGQTSRSDREAPPSTAAMAG